MIVLSMFAVLLLLLSINVPIAIGLAVTTVVAMVIKQGTDFLIDTAIVMTISLGGKLSAARQNAERDWKVERGCLLGKFCGGKVHHNPIIGPIEAAVDHGSRHPVGALSNRGVGQADKDRGREGATGNIDLNINRHGIDAEHREGLQTGKHE